MNYYIMNPIRLMKKKKLDWFDLWIKKSDYITNYYNSIKNKYKIIDESIDYYMVMMEMAIYYLKDYSNYYDYTCIQHEIIIDDKKDIKSIKEDIKERDFAEYLKYLFYCEDDINHIYYLIDNGKNTFNYYLVFARLLFPSHYLFYFERVVLDDKYYDKIENVVKNCDRYEKFLKDVSNRMNLYLIKKIILPF